MQFLLYLIIYPFIWIISILPFPVLYFLSDCLCFLIYRIFKYRKRVVRGNIALALPHLTEEERTNIEKKFYAHLCDLFLEMIKTLSISKKEIEKRYTFSNMEVYYELEKREKSIALLCAHYASYEWAVSMNYHIHFMGYGVYKKLANPYFDKLVRQIRSKFKSNLIDSKETIPTMATNFRNKNYSLYGLVSDQSPKLSATHHWEKFMGIEVPVHTGGEMLAKKYDMNVIFLKTKKLKRGYYEGSFEILCDENIKDIPNYEITSNFLKLVEQQIYDAPEFYLWTHKRWKHMR
ncbi:lysophospholipid acyltransferase family protein [Flavobacterium sp.]|uniref:lysophospholipid acyltransferase family protein n=1 Tax=Flavobacterium sp. TaxID=239 RepID=UPI0037BE413A